ncbi:MAG: sensor histidine kinase [Pseudonocardiaceae bacterium]
MRRLRLLIRRHPMPSDGLVAVLVLLVDLLAAPWQPVPAWLWTVTGLLLAAPLAVRRRWPLCAGALVLCGAALWISTHEPPTAFHFALVSTLIMVYTLLLHRGRWHAVGYGLALLAGLVLWSAWRVGPPGLLGALWLAVPWAAGEAVQTARAQRADAARRAAMDERIAIAREMHDVVAHAISVMVVHADGAAAQLQHDQKRAEQALLAISSTGRTTLTELRRVLGILRPTTDDGDGLSAGARAPQPGAEELAELTERMTAAGLATRLRLVGNLAHLSPTVSLGVYRITQEALTNALRHAGTGASATVEVTAAEGRVELTIRDNGNGALPSATTGIPGGNGLVGMQERAQACGGSLVAGPDSDAGGWLVRALLPA